MLWCSYLIIYLWILTFTLFHWFLKYSNHSCQLKKKLSELECNLPASLICWQIEFLFHKFVIFNQKLKKIKWLFLIKKKNNKNPKHLIIFTYYNLVMKVFLSLLSKSLVTFNHLQIISQCFKLIHSSFVLKFITNIFQTFFKSNQKNKIKALEI